MDIESERKAFERWYEDASFPQEHSNWFKPDKSFPDMYEIDFVEHCWQGWIHRANDGKFIDGFDL